MTDPTPYIADNGNRFTPQQARVITEPLTYAPRAGDQYDVVPFDTTRERWFHGYCGRDECGAPITGRSLDGGDVSWWHSMDIIDNDHPPVAPEVAEEWADEAAAARIAAVTIAEPRGPRKTLTDAELAAEYWRAMVDYEDAGAWVEHGNDTVDEYTDPEVMEARVNIIHRFATTPHTKDTTP